MFSDDLAASLENFGRRVSAAVDPMLAARQANEVRQTVAEGGDVAPTLGLTPLQRARNQVAQQAHLDRLKIEVDAEATRLHQEFSGQRVEDIEAFTTRLDAYARGKLDAIDEGFRGAAVESYAALRNSLVTNISERAYAAEDRRNWDDSKAADKLDSDRLFLAMRDGNDDLAAEAAKSLAARRMGYVEAGLMGEKEAELEAAQITSEALANRLVGQYQRGGGLSLEAVESGQGEAGALMQDHRDWLAREIRSVDADRRAAESHRLAVLNHTITANGRELDALSKKAEHGIPLSDAEKAKRDALLANEALVPADKYAEGVAARDSADVNRIVASYSRTKIEAQRAEWAANPPKTEAEFQTRERWTKAFERREAAVRSDPAAYVQQVAPEVYAPVILPDDPASPDMDAAIATAAQNFGIMRQHIGGNPNPFTKDQQAQLKNVLETAPPRDAAAVMAKIEAAFGPDAWVIQSGLREKGATQFARAGAMSLAGQPDVGRDIIEGAALIKSGAVKFTKDDVHKNAPDEIATLLAAVGGHSRAEQELRESAMALAAKMNPANPADAFKEALKMVGGDVGYYNGSPVLLPLGITEGQFLDRLAGMDTEGIEAAAGGTFPGAPEVASEIARDRALLESIGDGKYLVRIGTGYVMAPTGRPVVFDFAKMPERRGTRTTFDMMIAEDAQ